MELPSCSPRAQQEPKPQQGLLSHLEPHSLEHPTMLVVAVKLVFPVSQGFLHIGDMIPLLWRLNACSSFATLFLSISMVFE